MPVIAWTLMVVGLAGLVFFAARGRRDVRPFRSRAGAVAAVLLGIGLTVGLVDAVMERDLAAILRQLVLLVLFALLVWLVMRAPAPPDSTPPD
jgi:hypothetical protein